MPVPRSRDLAARGRRWRRPLDARGTRRRRAAREEEQRRLRPELEAGIGGSTRGGSLKCLHAHAAFALAQPGYELGERILAELPSRWPSDCCTPD
jgi:hypothetical protein